MVETLDAMFPATGEPTFATPDAAIKFSKMVNRARSHIDANLYTGRVIEAADCLDNGLRLHLDNGKVLRFSSVDTRVDVALEDNAPNASIAESYMPDSLLLRLNGKEIRWQRT